MKDNLMPEISEVYKNLYHYTTWSGLLGILQSNALWATHYKFLNDYTEIVLFRDKLVSLTRPYVYKAFEELIKNYPGSKRKINQAGGLEYVAENDTKVFVDAQYHATGDEIYIVSFCGPHTDPNINNNGLLSQWRGYGVGGGIALVFNSKKLEGMLDQEMRKHQYNIIQLSDVVYSDDEEKLKEELSPNLSILAEGAKNFFNTPITGQIQEEDPPNEFLSFVTCITRYKHYGFKEENEVRIVALPVSLDSDKSSTNTSNEAATIPEKDRRFRDENGDSIPYIEVFKSIGSGLPIEKIIVGPHKNKEKRASALRTMLRSSNIEITCSEIPYVNY